MHPAVIVFVYALAVARVTRLITEDRITEAPRRRLADWLWAKAIPARDVEQWHLRDHYSAAGARRIMVAERQGNDAEPPLAVYLLSCPWCASIYVAAVAAPIAYWWGLEPWFLVPALGLAFSYISGFLAAKE